MHSLLPHLKPLLQVYKHNKDKLMEKNKCVISHKYVTVVMLQRSSSLPSAQSFIPSQTQLFGMQILCPASHLNWLGGHGIDDEVFVAT
jgi:hypothetical protein